MAQSSNRNSNTVRSQPVPVTEKRAGDQSRPPGSLHLHIISESEGHALAEISQKVRSQYRDGQIVEHFHSAVRSRRQLGRALRDVEAAPGAVIYSLFKQGLANELEQFCKKINVPCFAGPKPHPGKESETSGRFRVAMLLSLALLLTWAVVTKSVVAYLADADSEITPRHPTATAAALVNSAEAKLNPISKRASEQGVTEDQQGMLPNSRLDENDNQSLSINPTDSQSLVEIRSLLELALSKDPLNARAFNLLGQVAQLQGDEQRTEQLMQAAVRHSLHNAYPVYWMLVRSYEAKDFSSAIYYADILLRATDRSWGNVVPILAKIAEIPEGSAELKQILKDNPPWRSQFFRGMKSNISDARTPLNLFLALENTPAPSTLEERSAYIAFLVQRGFYDLAYYTWLQFLPADQVNSLGGLFNGNFEITPTGAPFDWDFSNEAGVIVEVANHPDNDGRALFMKFGPGRVNFGGIKQLVVLPPGKYQFQGMQKADLVSKSGLFWQVTCVKTSNESSVRIGKGPTVEGRERAWKSFSFSFTVPDTGCPAQDVRFSSAARSASEQFMSGSVWFDDFQISREPIVKSQL